MLSEEEEAAILAEYGVLGLDDILVTVPAASRFRSDYGDTTVFLTGAADTDDNAQASARGGSSEVTDPTALLASQYPLEALLLKHTELLTASTPSTVTGALGGALHSLQHRDEDASDVQPVASSSPPRIDYGAILRQSRALEQRTAHITQGELSANVDLALVSAGSTAHHGNGARNNDAGSHTTPTHVGQGLAVADGAGDDGEVQRAAALLADAETVLAATTKPDATTDSTLRGRLDEVVRDMARLQDDAYDSLLERRDILDADDDDADLADILRRCADHTANWHSMRSRLSSESCAPQPVRAEEVQTSMRETAVRDVAAPLTAAPPSLFAFDMELSTSAREAAAAWEASAPSATPAPTATATAPVTPGVGVDVRAVVPFTLAPPVQTVLHSIAGMEERDRQQEAVVRASLRQAINVHHAKDKEAAAAALREQTGVVSLQEFVKRVDELLPPTTEETALRARHHHVKDSEAHPPSIVSGTQVGAEQPEAPVSSSSVSSPSSPTTLHTVQKRAARELFVIQREAEEARRMRHEEARMHEWMDHLSERREEIKQLLSVCITDAETSRVATESEEAVAFTELRLAEQRQLLRLRQAQRVRRMQATQQIAEDVLLAHAEGAADIEREAAAGLAQIVGEWESASVALHIELLTRYVDAVRQESAAFEQLGLQVDDRSARGRTLQLISPAAQSSTSSSVSLTDLYVHTASADLFSNVSTRLDALAGEARGLALWLHDHRRDVSQAVQASRESSTAIHQRIAERRHWRPPQYPSRPTTGTHLHESPSPPPSQSVDVDAGAPVLDQTRFRQLQALTIAAAQTDLVRAPQYLSSLTFALEQLTDVDYDSVAATDLFADTEEQRHRRRLLASSVRVSELVRDLNLGSNAFTALSLADLLETFPSLERLTLSDNELTSLTTRRVGGSAAGGRSRASTSVRGVEAARTSALAEMSRLYELDLSSNSLADVEGVGHSLYQSLRTLRVPRNQITSLVALSACGALMSLDVSRNPLSSLTGVEACTLLQDINACETSVSDLDGPTSRLLFLQQLYASQCRVASWPCSAGVYWMLTHLFLNQCGLREVPAESGAYMPFLTVLHVEGNQLTSIAGLVRCPRLQTVNVAANQLGLPNAVAPLRACVQLRSLDIRQNPTVQAFSERVIPSPLARKEALTNCLLTWFPQLSELNAEATACRTPPPSVMLAQQLLHLRRVWSLRATPWCVEYRATADLLAQDGVVCDARAALEVCVVDTSARLRAAQEGDERLLQRFASRCQPPLSTYQLSMEEAERGATARLAQCAASMDAMTSGETLSRTARVVTSCPTYWRRATLFSQSHAKSVIESWLYGLVLMRRAKTELSEKRRLYRQSEAFRREAAARRIQPLWRGAVLRSRLHRIVGPRRTAKNTTRIPADDEEEFVKVDEGFVMPELPDSDVGRLFQQVLDHRTHALPAFPVPQTVPGLVMNATPQSGAAAPLSGKADVLSFDVEDAAAPRAGTAPLQGSTAGGGGGGGKRAVPVLSEPQRPSSTALLHAPTESTTATLDSQWGATVAAQIRKKNRKMQTVHHQHTREQFLHDPLAAKKMLRSDKKSTKPSD